MPSGRAKHFERFGSTILRTGIAVRLHPESIHVNMTTTRRGELRDDADLRRYVGIGRDGVGVNGCFVEAIQRDGGVGGWRRG